MNKHGQDKDEQLERFRKAIPKSSWWTEQLKTCKNVDRAWEILVTEFAGKRELMDELLVQIDNYGTVKGDSKSLGRFATSVSVFVSNMEDNGCPVQEVGEAPFFMSKLELKDNADFEREMQR